MWPSNTLQETKATFQQRRGAEEEAAGVISGGRLEDELNGGQARNRRKRVS